jgi:hypothetical protein
MDSMRRLGQLQRGSPDTNVYCERDDPVRVFTYLTSPKTLITLPFRNISTHTTIAGGAEAIHGAHPDNATIQEQERGGDVLIAWGKR